MKHPSPCSAAILLHLIDPLCVAGHGAFSVIRFFLLTESETNCKRTFFVFAAAKCVEIFFLLAKRRIKVKCVIFGDSEEETSRVSVFKLTQANCNYA